MDPFRVCSCLPSRAWVAISERIIVCRSWMAPSEVGWCLPKFGWLRVHPRAFVRISVGQGHHMLLRPMCACETEAPRITVPTHQAQRVHKGLSSCWPLTCWCACAGRAEQQAALPAQHSCLRLTLGQVRPSLGGLLTIPLFPV